MAKIEWDKLDDREFEFGIERGVLYVEGKPGVPWNGLISVNENPTGGDVQSRYQDGVRTHQNVPYQEYEGEIRALTYPDEFDECLGLHAHSSGVYVNEQRRTQFGMSYQTKVGRGATNQEVGYRIHLIYNAVATPTQTERVTVSAETQLTEFAWLIKTTPNLTPGFRPTSQLVLDPYVIGPKLFSYIEDRLYGTIEMDPKLLRPEELFQIIENWHVLYPSTTTYPSSETMPGGP